MPRDAVRIGVVDSGFSELQSVPLSAAFIVRNNQLWLEESQVDRLGHGSQIVEIINTLAPDSEVISAQVFIDRFTTSAIQVGAAIDWLVAQGAQVINLSLGLRSDSESLRNACERAITRGVILCASSPARGEPVFPSAYPGVFRMTGDARCDRHEISYLNSRFADFGACVRPISDAIGSSGASVGCAHLTAHVAACLQNTRRLGIDDVRQWLVREACHHGPEHRGLVHE